jgi:hypothetical protein
MQPAGVNNNINAGFILSIVQHLMTLRMIGKQVITLILD